MKVVGHRGAAVDAPESTLASFNAAVEVGAHGIEFDVHRSADGDFFVIHDFSVDRTTNGSGLVSRLRSSTLDLLDAGSWFATRFHGERVPRLEDVLAIPDVELELEAKLFTHEDLEALADVVTAVGALVRVEFTSSNSPMLMELKRLIPAARIGVFSPRRQDWMVDDEIFESFVVSRAEFAEADVVHVHAEDIIPAVADRLHANGQVVHANDASTAEAITRAFRCGADRTTTDDPRMALSAIEVAASAT